MSPLAVFGINNDGLDLAVKLLVLFLVVLWLALVYWTYADSKRRIGDPMLVACATAASLFPFVGTVVYVVVRPPEYLDDVHERALEIAAAEARLASVEAQACPFCGNEVEKSFLRCPSCMHRLKEPCGTCGKPLDPRWSICPYCEAEVGARGEAPARPRRERSSRRERQPTDPARRAASATNERAAKEQTPRPARSKRASSRQEATPAEDVTAERTSKQPSSSEERPAKSGSRSGEGSGSQRARP